MMIVADPLKDMEQAAAVSALQQLYQRPPEALGLLERSGLVDPKYQTLWATVVMQPFANMTIQTKAELAQRSEGTPLWTQIALGLMKWLQCSFITPANFSVRRMWLPDGPTRGARGNVTERTLAAYAVFAGRFLAFLWRSEAAGGPLHSLWPTINTEDERMLHVSAEQVRPFAQAVQSELCSRLTDIESFKDTSVGRFITAVYIRGSTLQDQAEARCLQASQVKKVVAVLQFLYTLLTAMSYADSRQTLQAYTAYVLVS